MLRASVEVITGEPQSAGFTTNDFKAQLLARSFTPGSASRILTFSRI
jgi:hypothetical protein